MKPTAQSVGLFAAFVFSYVWVRSPSLNAYALQATALLVLLYFVAKLKTRHAKNIFPMISYEFLIFCCAFLLILGHSGGIHSVFLPLGYFLLFVSVFVLHLLPLSLFGLLLPLYLWAIAGTAPTTHEFSTILSFPLLLPLILFARLEYESTQKDEKEIESLEDQEHRILIFFSTFLKPKLLQILHLSEYPAENKEAIQKQLQVAIEETDQLTKQNVS